MILSPSTSSPDQEISPPPEHSGTLIHQPVKFFDDNSQKRSSTVNCHGDDGDDEEDEDSCQSALVKAPHNSYPFLFNSSQQYSFLNSDHRVVESEKLRKLKDRKEKKIKKQKDKQYKEIFCKQNDEEYDIDKALKDLGESGGKDEGKGGKRKSGGKVTNGEGEKVKKTSKNNAKNGVTSENKKDKLSKKKSKDNSQSVNNSKNDKSHGGEDDSSTSDGENCVEEKAVLPTPIIVNANAASAVSQKMRELEEEMAKGDLNRQVSRSTDDLSFTTVTKKKWKKKSPSTEENSASQPSSASSTSSSSSTSNSRHHYYEGRRSANAGYNFRNRNSQDSSRSSSISHPSSSTTAARAATNHLDLATDFPPLGLDSQNNASSTSESNNNYLSSTTSLPLSNSTNSAVTKKSFSPSSTPPSSSQQTDKPVWPVWRSSDQQAVINDNQAKTIEPSQLMETIAAPPPDITIIEKRNQTSSVSNANSNNSENSRIPDVAAQIPDNAKAADTSCSGSSSSSGLNTPANSVNSQNVKQEELIRTFEEEEPVVILALHKVQECQGIEFGFDLNESLLMSSSDTNPVGPMEEETQGAIESSEIQCNVPRVASQLALLEDDHAIVSFGNKGDSLGSNSGMATPSNIATATMCPNMSQVMQKLQASAHQQMQKEEQQEKSFVQLVNYISSKWSRVCDQLARKDPSVFLYH